MKSELPSKLSAALVGFGYWGPNLLRNLIAHGGFRVVGVVDASAEARAKAAAGFPFDVFSTLEELFAQTQPEVVLIATPPSTHREIALKCLAHQCHILVEKPLALSTAECDEIIASAKRAKRRVMVDHTFVYHPAVRYLHGMVEDGSLGSLLYYDSVRVNLGGFQPFSNVLWDLAPHDLSILDLLTGGRSPESISVLGGNHYEPAKANISYCHLKYADGFVAHLNLNWVAPVKIRTVIVGASKKMVIYDDNLASEKIKIYDRGLTAGSESSGHQLRALYRAGGMFAPAIETGEALGFLVSAFYSLVTEGKATPSGVEAGRRIVRILEAATLSMERGGEPVNYEQAIRKAA